MNAKKIMGAVLVALLAAALFVGAGAAAGTGETVFVNQILPETGYSGTWISGNNAVTALPVPGQDDKVYFEGPVVEGVYSQNDGAQTIVIKNKPAVSIVGIADDGVSAYKFIGGILYAGATPVNIYATAGSLEETTAFDLYYTPAGGVEEKMTSEDIAAALDDNENLKVGEYTIRAVFKAELFIDSTLASDLVTAPVTFKVAEAGDVTIAASVDQVLREEAFKVTITGEPGVQYEVIADNAGAFSVSDTQVAFVGTDFSGDSDEFTFYMPNTGSLEFAIAGTKDAKESEKLTVVQVQKPENKASVTVKFIKGAISAKTDAASYFVGDKVGISGVSTAGVITNLTIKGTNFEAEIPNLL
jgi:hypothetical protein